MLIKHSELGWINYTIVNFVPHKYGARDANSCIALSFKLDNRVQSYYLPIDPKTNQLIDIDYFDGPIPQEVFFTDARLEIPEEVTDLKGVRLQDFLAKLPRLRNEITQHVDDLLFREYLYNIAAQLWNDLCNKTLQLRMDLHDIADFETFGAIENYRIRNSLATTAAAMKELINNALTLERLNFVIENDKLFKKEYI